MSFNEEWKEVKLKKVVKSVSKTHGFESEKIILINTSDVLNGEVLNHKYKNNKNLKGQFKKSFKKHDILYSEIRPKNKRFAYVDFEASDYVASTKLMVLRKKTESILNKFLYYFLTSNKVINKLQHLAETRSGTFPQITFNEIADLSIKLPPKKIQCDIANIIRSLNKKIKLNNQMNETLEKISQAIYKNWFIDFEPFQDEEFVESEMGMIPKGWEVGEIGDIAKIQNGYGFSSKLFNDSGDIRVIKIQNINSHKVNINDTQFISKETANKTNKRYIIKPKSALIAMTGANVGKVGIVPKTDDRLYLNQRVGMIKNKISGGKDYTYICFLTDYYQRAIKNKAGGSAQPNVSATSLESIKIIIPPKNIFNNFTDIISTFINKICENLYQNQILAELRDTLLPKLMSGEIRVESFEKERG